MPMPDTARKTIGGCVDHDSLLRCGPDRICRWPACVGQIPVIEPGTKWNRARDGWRGEPSRIPTTMPQKDLQ